MKMNKLAIAAAAAVVLSFSMAPAVYAEDTTGASPATKMEKGVSDTWITTKVKSNLVTEKGIPGTDIKVETNQGVVSLSSTVAVTDSQKKVAVGIAKKTKGVKGVAADGLKAQ
jgi:hyperosmotically inducible protein